MKPIYCLGNRLLGIKQFNGNVTVAVHETFDGIRVVSIHNGNNLFEGYYRAVDAAKFAKVKLKRPIKRFLKQFVKL